MVLKEKKEQVVSQQVKASVAYTVCSVLQRSLSFITMPIFSNLLAPEEYGLSNAYQSVMAILITFTSLQLPYGSFAKAMIKYEDDRDGYVSAINGLCTVLTLIFFAVYFPFRKIFNGFMDLTTLLMTVMGFEMLMNTSMNLWMGKERFEYSYKKVVFVTFLMSVLTAIVGIVAVKYSTDKALAKVLSASLIVIFLGGIIYIYSIIKGHKFYDKEYWQYALNFNIPLIPYYLSQIIFNQSDKLMIDRMCSRREGALYGVAYSVAIIFSFVLNAINSSYQPWLYNKIKDQDFEDNKKVSMAIAAVMGILLLGLISIAPEFMRILHKDYYDGLWVIPPVAMSLLLLFYTQLFVNVEFFYEAKKYLVMGSILSAIINVVLNYFLIPVFGYHIAGYTTLISYILFAIGNYYCAMIVCDKNNAKKDMYDYKGLIIIMLLFLFCGIVLTLLYKHMIIRYILIVVVLTAGAVTYKIWLPLLLECIRLFR
ncbi:MAG: polysaccharide biosynthesis protein [Lachnospiraceae bacterium]|nr:polysaccharide biosynthesis protein [Erysipelotrichaceae bacterium]MBR4342432.1 polysaccharide biosynthesis protein [Lachnospiraceae bacterium]